jgi:Ca-activated chloride channel family protein
MTTGPLERATDRIDPRGTCDVERACRAHASRDPACIILVLDISSSMAGEKLDDAKHSMLNLIDHLVPGDFCGVVVFSMQVETLAAPEEMTDARKNELKRLVCRLQPGEKTNLGGGILAGLDHARVAKLPPGMLAHVLLLTDGIANSGPVKTLDELRALLEANRGDATLSALSCGSDAEVEVLRDLAASGKGRHARVYDPEDAAAAFRRELGGLSKTNAQRSSVRDAGGARTEAAVAIR